MNANFLRVQVAHELEHTYQDLAHRNPVKPGDIFFVDEWNALWAKGLAAPIVRPGGTGDQPITVAPSNPESMRALELYFHVMARIDWHRLQLVVEHAKRVADGDDTPALLSNAMEHLAEFDDRLFAYGEFYHHLAPAGQPSSVWKTWRAELQSSVIAMSADLTQRAKPYQDELARNVAERLETLAMPGVVLPAEEARERDAAETPAQFMDRLRRVPMEHMPAEQREMRDIMVEIGEKLQRVANA